MPTPGSQPPEPFGMKSANPSTPPEEIFRNRFTGVKLVINTHWRTEARFPFHVARNYRILFA
jgi:hypothetical protein